MATVNVKFGANVSEFNKAMQQSKNQLKQLQSEMNVTKTQSKLFGESMESLSKKQSLLQKSTSTLEKQIELMKNKNKDLQTSLTSLNKEHDTIKNKIKEVERAYQQSVKATGEDSKASKELKKELNSLNKEYAANERQIKQAERTITNNNNAINNNTKKILENKKALEDTTKAMANMKIEKVSKGFQNVSDTAGKVSSKLTPISTGIIGIGAASAKMSLSFEESFTKAMSLTGQTGKEAEKMKQGIMDLSHQTGISANEISENVYQAVSAGQSSSDALNFVKQNAMLAKTGFTDLSSAVDIKRVSVA